MNLKTRYNLWKLKRVMGPSTAFKVGLRKNLNTMWDAKYGNSASLYHVVVARVAGSFAVITMFLTGGGWVYAYTSPEVAEGSVLYPVKEIIEKVEEVTKITPEAKARFYIKKIERREAEREVLEKKIKLPEIKKDIKQDAKEEVKAVNPELKIEAEERRIKRTEKSIERIEEQLEKTRQIIEKNESKNIKLREELRIRAEKRLEKIKSDQEKLQQLRQHNSEVRNTGSIKKLTP